MEHVQILANALTLCVCRLRRLRIIHVLVIFQEEDQLPDFFYCSRVLEQTGLCICPGSDLGIPEGTHHIRYRALEKECS